MAMLDKETFIEEASKKRPSVGTEVVQHMGCLLNTTSIQLDRRIKQNRTLHTEKTAGRGGGREGLVCKHEGKWRKVNKIQFKDMLCSVLKRQILA